MGRIEVQSFTEKNIKAVGDGINSIGNGKLVVDKVSNYMSSICGSNSSDFNRYVGGRKRERDRLEQIEADAKCQQEAEEFEAKVKRNKEECEEKTRKNALKRQRKRENQKKNKLAHASNCAEADNNGSDGEGQGITSSSGDVVGTDETS